MQRKMQRLYEVSSGLTAILFFWGEYDCRKQRKESHFVNIYRKVWCSNEGLWSDKIAAMSDDQLQKSIENLKKFDDMQEKPKPGDVVQVVRSDDCLIAVGARGVIQGIEEKVRPAYAVLFNWSPMPWWDKGHIESSGGPEKWVPTIMLRATGKKVNQEFHYFPGLPAAHSAKTEVHNVALWEIDLFDLADKARWAGIDIEDID